MLTERWPEIDDLFQAALELPPSERDALLLASCQSDALLRNEVKSLLGRYDQDCGRFQTTIFSATLFQRALLAPELTPGQRTGKYRIVSPIGRGGMGEVYLAEDTTLGRKVAFKLLPAAIREVPDFSQRIFAEARLASALNHPNIVTVFEVGEVDGLQYMAMEYIDGVTLRERLVHGALPMTETLHIAAQVASALGAAHAAGVVHSDINPENVMVRPDGVVKVLDFGIASVRQAPTSVPDAQQPGSDAASAPPRVETAKGLIFGSLPYMSPEQARGESVDARSDIFSFGALLFELLTGTPAFSGRSNASVLVAVANVSPSLPVEVRAPAKIRALLVSCLEKSPDTRAASMDAVRAELENIERSLRPNAPLRRLVWVGGAAGILIIVAALAALWFAPPKTSPMETASIAVLPFADVSPVKGNEYVAQGITAEVRTAFMAIPSVRVAGSSSSAQFKGKAVDLRSAGRSLHVEDVLSGSVSADGKRLKITAQLLRVGDGTALWSEQFDKDQHDIFAIQREIVQAVTRTLGLKVDPKVSAPPIRDNIEAYSAYRQGNFFNNLETNEARAKAVQYFQLAVKLDPSYATAWAELSDATASEADNNMIPREEGYRTARQEAERALALDPNLPNGYQALGEIQLQHDLDWDGAEKSMNRALTLSPRDPYAMLSVGAVESALGRFDRAAALMRQAIDLDPASLNFYIVLGETLTNAGRLEESEAALKKGLEFSPGNPDMTFYLSRVYVLQGRPEDARALVKAQTDQSVRLFVLALAYQALRQRAQSAAALGQLVAKFAKEEEFNIAEVYAFRGEADRAFEWLDRAYSDHDTGLSTIKGDPFLRNLEPDSRYAAFLAKMHLPN